VKLETLKARLLGRSQAAVAVLVSSQAVRGEMPPRVAIDAFLRSLGPVTPASPTEWSGPDICAASSAFSSPAPQAVDAARVSAMADALAHRGAGRQRRVDRAGDRAGHRRLSIIDLGGAQPMATRTAIW
jgi:hypothetical protein